MRTIVWKGIACQSLEYCRLTEQGDMLQVQSKIIGACEGKVYTADYAISIDASWTVQRFHIDHEVNNRRTTINGVRQDQEWYINDLADPRLNGIDFIDISVTPFTNTLPIRSLQLETGQEQEITVIYINILDNYIQPVQQHYRKNGDGIYHYENVPKDFEADIRVDDAGLVLHYPTLFERLTAYKTAAYES